MTALSASWNYPTQIHFGQGQAQQLASLCKELFIARPLFVTDPGIAPLAMFQASVQNCQAQGLNCEVFSDIHSNPTEQDVFSGVEAYKQAQCDGVIAFGGGSAIDGAKAIALMVGQTRPIWDFEDIGDNWRRVDTNGLAPVIALPTTAGTGSEVGRASVITDTEQKRKRLLFHPNMMPAHVILDPLLSRDLPPKLTAATGMDALSHALEAYCANGFHPMADGIATQAISLIEQNLINAFHDGHNLEVRGNMLVASSMGAIAFQKGLGAMHALAHPLGAQYNAHHGLLNAILMPYVLSANRSAINTKLKLLARNIGLLDTSFDGFLHWVLKLRRELGIPHSLQDIDINADKAPLIAQMAIEDPSAAGNPIAFNTKEYEQILLNAIRGEL